MINHQYLSPDQTRSRHLSGISHSTAFNLHRAAVSQEIKQSLDNPVNSPKHLVATTKTSNRPQCGSSCRTIPAISEYLPAHSSLVESFRHSPTSAFTRLWNRLLDPLTLKPPPFNRIFSKITAWTIVPVYRLKAVREMTKMPNNNSNNNRPKNQMNNRQTASRNASSLIM